MNTAVARRSGATETWLDPRSSARILVVGYLVAALAVVVHPGCAASGGNARDPVQDVEINTIAREIEEADIVKFRDGYFFLANRYTGLRVIDCSDMDRPRLAGRIGLGGKAVEMFLVDDIVFLHTSSDVGCVAVPVGAKDGLTGAPDYSGSRLWVIDVADKAEPQLLSTLDTAGFVTGTRRVGDVIYVAGNSSNGRDAFITSIDIAEPDQARLVQSQEFRGQALDIFVSPHSMYVIGNDPNLPGATLATYVDISDPAGRIAIRDQFRVPGRVQNRFFVDEFEGVFRVVTEQRDSTTFTQLVSLYTYDVQDPDDIVRLAELPIVSNESLRAVRFDGHRGYAVTFLQIDPLFVLDISDPAEPRVTGELEVPGWSTHLVPMGDRLVGVGFDDASGRRPAVALYDVSDTSGPRQLDRVVVSGFNTYGASSEATVDEKALKVISGAGLILLPFSVYDFDVARNVDALQIISLSLDSLEERGVVEHRGLVRRADIQDERVWILSDLSFQTIDIADLDEPQSLRSMELINDQTLLDAGLSGCVDSARTRGTPIGPVFVDTFDPGLSLLSALLELLFFLVTL